MEGKTIAEVRTMTNEEMEQEGWEHYREKPPVIVLEDGTKLFPSQDPEGNGPGALFGVSSRNTPITINPQ